MYWIAIYSDLSWVFKVCNLVYIYLVLHVTYYMWTLYTVYCTTYIVRGVTLYNVHSVQCVIHFMQYTQCTLYTVHYILITIQLTWYTIHCTLYTIQCTVFSGNISYNRVSTVNWPIKLFTKSISSHNLRIL